MRKRAQHAMILIGERIVDLDLAYYMYMDMYMDMDMDMYMDMYKNMYMHMSHVHAHVHVHVHVHGHVHGHGHVHVTCYMFVVYQHAALRLTRANALCRKYGYDGPDLQSRPHCGGPSCLK